MTFPVQHCLLYPDRQEGVAPTLDFSNMAALEFQPVDPKRFPCLELARQAMVACGVAPGVFNAANEIAAEAFVDGTIRFTDIPKIIEKTLERIDNKEPSSIDEVLSYDQRARAIARETIAKIG